MDVRRLEASALRDDEAADRDFASDLREGAARRAEAVLLASDPENAALRVVVAANSQLRDDALADRRRAAVDRGRAAEDRLTAAAAQRQARLDVQDAQLEGLTGVYAREVGLAALTAEIDRCRRADDPFVLACISIDRSSGRSQGIDDVASTLVRVLRAQLRSYDPVVRVSSEEFLCGMPAARPDVVVDRTDRIRAAVRHGHPPGMISAGFAELRSGDGLDVLIDRAHDDMVHDRSAHERN